MFTCVRRTLFTVLSAMVCAHATAHAQSTAVDSAIGAARQKIVAYVRRDYLNAAELTHPAQLRSTRLAFDTLFREQTSGQIAGTSLGVVFQVDSVSKLQGWSDERFAASIIGFWVGMTGNTRFTSVELVETPGAVAVGRDTVLVVYRMKYRDKYVGGYSVEAMSRCPRGWCSDLPVNLPGLLAMMRMPRTP